MKFYCTVLGNSTKWYRHIPIKLLLGTFITNAYIVSRKSWVAKESISLNKPFQQNMSHILGRGIIWKFGQKKIFHI